MKCAIFHRHNKFAALNSYFALQLFQIDVYVYVGESTRCGYNECVREKKTHFYRLFVVIQLNKQIRPCLLFGCERREEPRVRNQKVCFRKESLNIPSKEFPTLN